MKANNVESAGARQALPQVRFRKLHGCGNNFIVLAEKASLIFWSREAKRLLDRDTGLGTDGLMVLGTKSDGVYNVKMFNPDGSECGMCGNGIRCVTRYLFLEQMVDTNVREVSFNVNGRRIVCTTSDEGRNVRVNMGSPHFDPRKVPIAADGEYIDAELRHGAERYMVTCVSMGNPHCVIFVSDLKELTLAKVGPELEHHPLFPERANIEFAEIITPRLVKVAVWERGVGATLACGTGACAVVAAGVRTKRLEPRCSVELPGGVVEIDFSDRSTMYMTGPTEEVFQGELSNSFVATLNQTEQL